MQSNLYKNNETDKVMWLDNPEVVGEFIFTFDEKTMFNLFRDYPYKLSKAQKLEFDKENPFWADFFKDRS
jgi:hypothetical protein